MELRPYLSLSSSSPPRSRAVCDASDYALRAHGRQPSIAPTAQGVRDYVGDASECVLLCRVVSPALGGLPWTRCWCDKSTRVPQQPGVAPAAWSRHQAACSETQPLSEREEHVGDVYMCTYARNIQSKGKSTWATFICAHMRATYNRGLISLQPAPSRRPSLAPNRLNPHH